MRESYRYLHESADDKTYIKRPVGIQTGIISSRQSTFSVAVWTSIPDMQIVLPHAKA